MGAVGKVYTRTLSPWADVNRRFSNMKALEVRVGGKKYAGKADLDLDDAGLLTISFQKTKGRK